MSDTELIIASRRMVTDGRDGPRVGPGVVRASAGRIVDVSYAEAPGGGACIDVGDLVLMPGLVDTHVHINEPGRTEWEGFASAGRAAAAGGVTTMVVMPLNCSPVATTLAALRGEAAAAADSCIIDYGLWGGVIPGNQGDLAALWDAGALGFKCFMVHSGIDEFPNVTEADLEVAMPILAGLTPGGAVLMAHAENPGVIDGARGMSRLDANPSSYAAYLASRPPEAEERAIELMIRLARKYASRTHIVHVSAASALPALSAARREGVPITTETCPHYLAFCAEEIGDGQTTFKCAPPIRGEANREELWRGLREGVIDLVASDHSPCPPELKQTATGNFAQAWGGISSLQLGLPVMWTHARGRGFSLSDIARWMCAAPARMAGIDSVKGRIAPGCDADFVVWNPEEQWTVDAATLHHRHKITPYDGAVLSGVVKATFVRGRLVYAAPGFHTATPPPLGQDGFATGAGGQWIKRPHK